MSSADNIKRREIDVGLARKAADKAQAEMKFACEMYAQRMAELALASDRLDRARGKVGK